MPTSSRLPISFRWFELGKPGPTAPVVPKAPVPEADAFTQQAFGFTKIDYKRAVHSNFHQTGELNKTEAGFNRHSNRSVEIGDSIRLGSAEPFDLLIRKAGVVELDAFNEAGGSFAILVRE